MPAARRPWTGLGQTGAQQGQTGRVEAVEVAQLVGPGAARERESGRERPRPAPEGQRPPRSAPEEEQDEDRDQQQGAQDERQAARSGPSTTSGTSRPRRPASAAAEVEEARSSTAGGGRIAVTALAAVTTLEPDAPSSRATSSGEAPIAAPAVKAAVRAGRGRGTCAPARTSPAAIPTNAGIASDEFQTARPADEADARAAARPSAPPTAPVPAGARATSRGKPVTSGIRKLGGGPVAVISPCTGVPDRGERRRRPARGRPSERARQKEDEQDQERRAQEPRSRERRGARARGAGRGPADTRPGPRCRAGSTAWWRSRPEHVAGHEQRDGVVVRDGQGEGRAGAADPGRAAKRSDEAEDAERATAGRRGVMRFVSLPEAGPGVEAPPAAAEVRI